MTTRKPYPSDVSDEEWAFVAPYLTLMSTDAPQRVSGLREVFNGLRSIVKPGMPWLRLPHDLPPWPVVSPQARRWLAAGCFEAIVHDRRSIRRVAEGRPPQPSAVIVDRQTLHSTPERGARAGSDGAKRTQGAKVHAAVDTLGNLLALQVTPADEQDRARVERRAAVPEATGTTVDLAYVDQGSTGAQPAAEAAAHGIQVTVVKHPEGRQGFVLLPRRWVMERSFAWKTRFRRLVRDYERLATTLASLHSVACAVLLLHRSVAHLVGHTRL